jgi:hypothetical protein
MDRDTLKAVFDELKIEGVDQHSVREMGTKANPIGVVTYELQPRLSAEMKSKLPSTRQLRAVVRSVLPEEK